MKKFIAFVKKEFRHILRDRRTLLILLGMPVVQIVLFGYAITNEFRNASIVVLDQSRDELSRELTEKLIASGHFRLLAEVQSYEELHTHFKKGKIKLAVVIPPDFTQKVQREDGAQVQLIADGSEPNYASTLVTYANQIVADFRPEQPGLAAAQSLVGIEIRMLFNPELRSAYLFVPGVIALILMLISAMMTSLTIAREKEQGTMELLLVSPLPPLLIVVGKVIPYVVLAFSIGMIALSLGVLVFGVPVKGSLLLLLAMSMLYVLTALSLGVLISTKAPTQQIAMMASLGGLMLPTVLLSDFIFPLASMPLPLQLVGNAIPARWFISILRDLLLKGTGWRYIWQEAAVLGGMSLVLLVLAMKNFKTRLG